MLLEIVGLLLPFLVISEFLVMADTFYIFIEFAWYISTYPLYIHYTVCWFSMVSQFLAGRTQPWEMQISCPSQPLAPGAFLLSCLDVIPKAKAGTEPLKPLRLPRGHRRPIEMVRLPMFTKNEEMQTMWYSTVRQCTTCTTKRTTLHDLHNQETPLYRSGKSHLSSVAGAFPLWAEVGSQEVIWDDSDWGEHAVW